MSKAEIVYAIRVTHTKKGKPRKKLAWASWDTRQDRWRISTYRSLAYHIAWEQPPEAIRAMSEGGGDSKKEVVMYHTKRCEEAEAALGCKCKVVAIELRERAE